MHRAMVTLVLASCAVGCSGGEPPDVRSTPATVEAQVAPAGESAPPQRPAADAAPSSAPAEPKVPFEQALECRKKHCYPPAAHCMDVCYRYNHPRAEEHQACDETCRHNYGVRQCEALCENEPRAFLPFPKGPPSCVRELVACRESCKDRRSHCEAHCIAQLDACAEAH